MHAVHHRQDVTVTVADPPPLCSSVSHRWRSRRLHLIRHTCSIHLTAFTSEQHPDRKKCDIHANAMRVAAPTACHCRLLLPDGLASSAATNKSIHLFLQAVSPIESSGFKLTNQATRGACCAQQPPRPQRSQEHHLAYAHRHQQGRLPGRHSSPAAAHALAVEHRCPAGCCRCVALDGLQAALLH